MALQAAGSSTGGQTLAMGSTALHAMAMQQVSSLQPAADGNTAPLSNPLSARHVDCPQQLTTSTLRHHKILWQAAEKTADRLYCSSGTETVFAHTRPDTLWKQLHRGHIEHSSHNWAA